MKFLPALIVVSLVIVPSVAFGQQISPNPNPQGNTITVSNNGALNSVSFQNFGTIDITQDGKLNNDDGNSTRLDNYGTLNNAGTLDNDGVVANNVGHTLNNTGTLDNSATVNNQGVVNNNVGGTLNNTGTLTNTQATLNNGGLLNNTGTLDNPLWSTLNNNVGGTLNNNVGGRLENGGTLDNSGTLNNGGIMFHFGTLNNSGSLDNSGALENYGTLHNILGAVLNNTHDLDNNDGGVLNNGGTLNNSSTLDSSGTITNSGVFNQISGRFTTGELFTGGTFNFTGGVLEITDSSQALTVGTAEFSLTNGATFNTDAGTTTLGSGQHLEIAGAATIASGATLTLSGGSLTSGSFTNNGTIHTASGTSSISADMQLNGTMQVDTGSQLVLTDEVTGGGTFAGAGEVTFQGNLRPGNSPGRIEFGGDVTLDATSTTFIEIAGLTDAEFDRLVLSGSDPNLTIASGAQVNVQLINGFSLDYNQEFVFADVAGSNAVSGAFNGLGEGGLVGNFGGFNLFISYSAGTGNDISFFTSVPEPGALVTFGLVVGLGGMRRRRRRAVSEI